jgi:hypothetical protein
MIKVGAVIFFRSSPGVPGHALQNAKPIYDVADANRARGKLVTLCKAALPDAQCQQRHG